MLQKTFKIQIKGRVQGVGFRPCVFNLARQHQLKGTVSNNENGVVIYCNATGEIAKAFLKNILRNKPENSIVVSHELEQVVFRKFYDFSIVSPKVNSQIKLPLTPDFAICLSCKAELSDPKNRRFNYAFTTCVHCGPRYAITTKFPFERANTSLVNFQMCALCNKEYSNPGDRRFHSQTNSCACCGIQLELTNSKGKTIAKGQEDILSNVVQLLSEGYIVAIKNTNGYLLCCDATKAAVVNRLRMRKIRPKKPFAILYPSIESVKKEFDLSPSEIQALQSRIAPIVLLQNTKKTNFTLNAIAPNLQQTGVMLPSSALLELIIQKMNAPLVATSGNIHGSAIIADKAEAQNQLKEVADYMLHHELTIEFPQDDSVVKFIDGKQLILRRSRGLAPNYIGTKLRKKETVLAMGAHLKSTFTFVPNGQTYVSQYFGNLDNYDVSERYKATIKHHLDLFETVPKTILIDKHPQYQSSISGKILAAKWNANLQEIQHHKAHFTSVLGEHDLFNSKEKVLGIIWDGTGLGEDNTIWGGEFFIYQNRNIQRLTHFEYYDWLANDKMAKEPRLALFSLLDGVHKNKIRHKFTATEWNLYSKSIKTNTLKTSSVGRLFDAVASVLDLADINTYEAEAAMLLENCARAYSKSNYIDFLPHEENPVIPSKKLIQAVANAYQKGFCKKQLAYSFIYTLAKCGIKLAKKHQFKTIACSGGVFQNAVLIANLNQMAKKEKIKIVFNRKLSANDENISYGQLMYYQHLKNENNVFSNSGKNKKNRITT